MYSTLTKVLNADLPVARFLLIQAMTEKRSLSVKEYVRKQYQKNTAGFCAIWRSDSPTEVMDNLVKPVTLSFSSIYPSIT